MRKPTRQVQPRRIHHGTGPKWSNACQGGLVLAGGYAYWANDTGYQIIRIPLAGGSGTVIASGQKQPCFIAVDEAHAYWTNIADGSVAKAPLAGGPVVELAASADWVPTGIAVDEHCVYWAASLNGQGGAILRVAK